MNLSLDKLHSLALRLQGHHSVDHRFLARIGRSFPTMADYKESWKCKTCKKVAKASAHYCAHCGNHWSSIWDPSFSQAGSHGSYANASSTPRSPRSSRSQWPELPARSPSRRQRQKAGRTAPKGEGKGKSKKDSGKGGNASSGRPPNGQAVSVPQLQAEIPWAPPAAPTAPALPSAPQPAPLENAQVKNLLSALKKVSADLPPEVQAAMQKMHGDDDKQLTKQLHSAVSQLGNSKKALADLSAARSNLHSSWNTFLESAITRWVRYSEDFTQQDKDLAAQIEKAKETMKACKEHFKSLQALEGPPSSAPAEVISDEEDSALPSKVDVHMQQMQDSLKLLKGGMEEELRGAKRQRVEEEGLGVTGEAGPTASLCGQGGK